MDDIIIPSNKIPNDEMESFYFYSQGLEKQLGFFSDDWYQFGIRFIDRRGAWTPIFMLKKPLHITNRSYYNPAQGKIIRPSVKFQLSERAKQRLLDAGYYQYVLYVCNEESKQYVVTQGLVDKLMVKQDATTRVYFNSWFFRPIWESYDSQLPRFTTNNVFNEDEGQDNAYNFSVAFEGNLLNSSNLGSEVQFFSGSLDKGVKVCDEEIREFYEPLIDIFKTTKNINLVKCIANTVGRKTFTHLSLQTFTANTMYCNTQTAGLLNSDFVNENGYVISGVPIWQDGISGVNVTSDDDVYEYMLYPWMGGGPMNNSYVDLDIKQEEIKNAEEALPSRLKKKIWSVSQLFNTESKQISDKLVNVDKINIISDMCTFLFKSKRFVYQKNNDIILNYCTDPSDKTAYNFFIKDNQIYLDYNTSTKEVSNPLSDIEGLNRKKAATQTGFLFLIVKEGNTYKFGFDADVVKAMYNNNANVGPIIKNDNNRIKYCVSSTDNWQTLTLDSSEYTTPYQNKYFLAWCNVENILKLGLQQLFKYTCLYLWQTTLDDPNDSKLSSYNLAASETSNKDIRGFFEGIGLFELGDGNTLNRNNVSNTDTPLMLRILFDDNNGAKSLTKVAPYTTVSLSAIIRDLMHHDSQQKVYINLSDDAKWTDNGGEYCLGSPENTLRFLKISTNNHMSQMGQEIMSFPYAMDGFRHYIKSSSVDSVSGVKGDSVLAGYTSPHYLRDGQQQGYFEKSHDIDSPFYAGGQAVSYVPVTLPDKAVNMTIVFSPGQWDKGREIRWGHTKNAEEYMQTITKATKASDISTAYKYGIQGFKSFVDCTDDNIKKIGNKSNKIITATGRGCDHLILSAALTEGSSESTDILPTLPISKEQRQLGCLQIYNAYADYPEDGENSKMNYTNSMFTPCSHIVPLSKKLTGNDVWGDTFFQRYYILKHYGAVPPDTNNYDENTFIENVCTEMGVLLESRNNLACRCDKNIYNKNKQYSQDGYNHNLINRAYLTKFDLFNDMVRDDKFYDNNKDYSSDYTWSDMKHNNELNDTYCNISLIKQQQAKHSCGQITKIINFADKLFMFQHKGVGIINYNERAMIDSSDNQIKLGDTGVVNGVTYISTDNGCLNRHCVCPTNTALFYLDSETMSFNSLGQEGIKDVSSTFGMKTFFKNNMYQLLRLNSDGSFFDKTALLLFDKINNELHIINKDTDLVYDCLSGTFMSFFDYENTMFIDNFYKHYLIHNNQFYEREAGDYNDFFGVLKPHYMEVLFNGSTANDKIFTNVEFVAEKFKNDNKTLSSADDIRHYNTLNYRLFVNDTFNKLEAHNEYQFAKIDLKAYTNRWSPLKQKFRQWNIQLPRVVSKNNPTDGLNYGIGYGFDRLRNPWIWLKFVNEREDDILKHVFHGFLINYFE